MTTDNNRNEVGLNLQDKLCVTEGGAGNMDVPKPFGAQKIVVSPRCQALSYKIWSYSAGLWFLLSMIVFMPWFFPFRVRKYLTCFVCPVLPIIQELSQKTLRYFKETLNI